MAFYGGSMKRIGMLCLLSAAVISWSFALGNGDSFKFPGNKQISLIVPYSAGGASDTTARIYASELEKALPGTITVSNITGASGATGLTRVKNAKADGYTIAYMPVESTMLRALGLTDLSTDDFKFIGRAMTIPSAVTVKADSPWKTIEDFIAYAKANPGKVRVGNSGTGSIWHVAAASVEDKCGVKFTHVPFEGAAPAVTALAGGNIEAVTVSPSEVQSLVNDGKLRVLIILGEGRSSVVPNVPTAREKGIDIAIQGWGAFAVPKGTPAEIVSILEKASSVALNSAPVKELLASRGFEHAYLSGSDMDAAAAKELSYYGKLIPALLKK